MTRLEAVLAAAFTFLMLTAALTWRFGWIGLGSPAVVALVFIILTSDFERD